MDYQNINNFLEKFKDIIFQKETTYKFIAETIEKHIGSEIDSRKIKINGTVIKINSSPILKNEILIHKIGILNDLSSLSNKFTDIN